MPVIAIVNRKGGSGKSTLATNVAAYCARQGLAVMLGDVDRQQSTRTWLRLRNPALPSIAPWAVDHKQVMRVPTGITHVVLDTPGGMQGFELARVVMFADAILMPVCNSVFDRESAAAGYAELKTLPRVASGRCRVATVGMRIDGRTRAGEQLQQWSSDTGLPFLGALRDTLNYVRTVERGLSIFDLPPSQGAQDAAQWAPILSWLAPLMQSAVAANDDATGGHGFSGAPTASAQRLGRSRAPSLMPAQDSLVHGGRLQVLQNPRQPVIRNTPAAPTGSGGVSAMTNDLPIPRFLQR